MIQKEIDAELIRRLTAAFYVALSPLVAAYAGGWEELLQELAAGASYDGILMFGPEDRPALRDLLLGYR